MFVTNNKKPTRRAVLIFGDPGHGKSTLLKNLKEHGYHSIGLDEVYVEFIQGKYRNLYLEVLRQVIAQHFHHIFGQIPANVEAWANHVASLTEKAVQDHNLVAVEGYLMLPALEAVQQRLAGKATLTIVEARQRQYFVASSIEQIVKGSH